MYFWKIDDLKADLAARPMTDREVLPYFILDASLTSLGLAIPSSSFNLWDLLELAWDLGLAVFGTLYLFRQNGASQGSQFLQRSLAIGWIVGLRWCVWLIPLYGMLLWSEIFTAETNAIEFLCEIIVNTLLVLRIGGHLHGVATSTPDTESTIPPAST